MAKKEKFDETTGHKHFAVSLFNHTWSYITKKKRTPEDDDLMIHAAHASRFHWSKVGDAKNFAIGEWQVSHVYAILGRAEAALYHAERGLELCKKNKMGDFVLAYAYESLARAHKVSGNKKEFSKFLNLAKEAGAAIKEKEDRELFEQDIKGL